MGNLATPNFEKGSKKTRITGIYGLISEKNLSVGFFF